MLFGTSWGWGLGGRRRGRGVAGGSTGHTLRQGCFPSPRPSEQPVVLSVLSGQGGLGPSPFQLQSPPLCPLPGVLTTPPSGGKGRGALVPFSDWRVEAAAPVTWEHLRVCGALSTCGSFYVRVCDYRRMEVLPVLRRETFLQLRSTWSDSCAGPSGPSEPSGPPASPRGGDRGRGEFGGQIATDQGWNPGLWVPSSWSALLHPGSPSHNGTASCPAGPQAFFLTQNVLP